MQYIHFTSSSNVLPLQICTLIITSQSLFNLGTAVVVRRMWRNYGAVWCEICRLNRPAERTNSPLTTMFPIPSFSHTGVIYCLVWCWFPFPLWGYRYSFQTFNVMWCITYLMFGSLFTVFYWVINGLCYILSYSLNFRLSGWPLVPVR